MSELFLKIVNMSISASWLVLAVLLLRIMLKKVPKWVSVLLWGFVAVRLICPFSLESVLSLIPSTETISPEIMTDWTPEINTGIDPLNSVVNPVISSSFAPKPWTSANPLQILIPAWANLWVLGMIGMLLYSAVSYLLLRRKVTTAVQLKENIFQSENVALPFVLGIIKPKIYLPFNMSEQDMEHVVAHEQAHICRKDHLWKPLGFLLLALHCFNPLMWLGYVLLCRDIELACDEKVIRQMDNENRADYTQVLVACSVNRRSIAACPLAFGEVGVKERVKSVMNYKKPAFWILVTAIIVCIAVAVCFLTNPMDQVALKDLKQGEINMPGTLSNVTDLCVTYKEDSVSCTEKSEIDHFLATLDKINVSKKPISLNRSEDRSKAFTVQVNGNTELHFNESFTKLWIDNHVKPSLTHRITNPEIAKELRLDYVFAVSSAGGTDALSNVIIRPNKFFVITENFNLSAEPESPLDAAISAAIFEHNNSDVPEHLWNGESHSILATEAVSGTLADEQTEAGQEVTVYIMYWYLRFKERNLGNAYQNTLVTHGGFSSTAAITFTVTEDEEYILKEFWEPGDDGNYQKDIRSKYPIEVVKFLLIDHEARDKLSAKLYKKCDTLVTRYWAQKSIKHFVELREYWETQIFDEDWAKM